MPPRLVDVHELARALDVPDKAVRHWARHGLIPSVKVSNQYFFNLQSVVRVLNGQATAAVEELTTTTP